MASRSAATLRRKIFTPDTSKPHPRPDGTGNGLPPLRLRPPGRGVREAVSDYPDEVESKHIVECFSAGDFLNCLFSANYLSRRQIISVDGKLARCEACLLLFRRRRCLPKSHCNTFSYALVPEWCFAVVKTVGSPPRWLRNNEEWVVLVGFYSNLPCACKVVVEVVGSSQRR